MLPQANTQKDPYKMSLTELKKEIFKASVVHQSTTELGDTINY